MNYLSACVINTFFLSLPISSLLSCPVCLSNTLEKKSFYNIFHDHVVHVVAAGGDATTCSQLESKHVSI